MASMPSTCRTRSAPSRRRRPSSHASGLHPSSIRRETSTARCDSGPARTSRRPGTHRGPQQHDSALIQKLSGRRVPAIPEEEYDDLYVVTVPSFGRSSVLRLKY